MKQNGQSKGSLQIWLTRLVKQIEDVQRWKHYQHSHPQNVLEHTLETALLTQVVIALETQFGTTKFDSYRLLSSAIVHDLGEGIIGDVAFDVKNDPRVKEHLEAIEKERFRGLFEHLGLGLASVTVAQTFEHAFVVQEERETVEGRLFNAIEKIGYVIYALRELDAGHGHFAKVLAEHHAPLLEYAKEFVSIQMLYDICLIHMNNVGTKDLLGHGFPIEDLPKG